MKAEAVSSKKMKRLVDSLAKLIPHRAKKECTYCFESRLEKHFQTITILPRDCHGHLSTVCRKCIRRTLEAQLGFRPLLEVGCPSCRVPWTGHTLRKILGFKGKKRFKELDILAKQQTLTPIDLPEAATLDEMLERGTRFCPWCPFVKEGGCDSITCKFPGAPSCPLEMSC